MPDSFPPSLDDRKRHTDEALTKLHVPGLKLVAKRPAGSREFREIVAATEKALRFRYYGWLLWAPKRAIVQIRGQREFWVQAWAVETAKSSASAERVDH